MNSRRTPTSRKRALLTVVVFVVLPLVLAACGSPDGTAPGDSGSPAPTDSSAGTPAASPRSVPPAVTASPSGGRTVVSVYFMRGQSVGTAHRVVPATTAPARAAVTELLSGPSANEQAAGLHTNIPLGARLLGLTIRAGVATVDLSGEFTAGVGPLDDRGRLAQVVYTLTQFSTVQGVRFRIEGVPLVFRSGEGQVQRRPQTRASYEDVTPAIFVELPAVGDHVGSPLVITGTANTFEAQLFARVRDAAGESLVNKSIMATSGSGTRGTFNESLSFTTASSRITLEVYERSAADGRPVNTVKIPLVIAEGGVQ